jgi:hypothetical protein
MRAHHVFATDWAEYVAGQLLLLRSVVTICPKAAKTDYRWEGLCQTV